MAYSILNLGAPKRSSLLRAAGVSSVYKPQKQQPTPGGPAPDYTQQLGQLQAGNIAPDFAPGTPNAANSSSPFSFTNAGNAAFKPFQMPQGPTTASFAGQQVDYGNDPILQQAQAAAEMQVQQAQAAAQQSEVQNLIRYGSGDLLKQVLGSAATQDQINAANNNTFGTVQELGRWNTRALSGVDEAANRNNLFFSSARARDRGLQQEDYQRR